MHDDDQLTFADYIGIARRRAGLAIGGFFGTLVLGVGVAMLLPPVYRATGAILIESQQIPTDLVQATVTTYADERIEVIKQRVMTRENLLRVIRKYNLFADSGPTVTPSDQIDDMRKTIEVQLVNADVKPDRRGLGTAGSGTIAFRLSFEHKRPEVAQAVANDLMTLFLEENVRVRTQRATQTTEFLTQEADKLKKELDGLEAQIAKYKNEHGRALPENFALGMASMQRLEADLRQLERDSASTEQELRGLEAEREAAASGQMPLYAAGGGTNSFSELQKAKADVARLSATYTDDHPDVKAAKRKVENLTQAVASEGASAGPGVRRASTGGGGAFARIDARIGAMRQRLQVLEGQKASVRGRLAQMDVSLVRSPEVERGFSALTRDYQSAQKKYEEILAKKMTAQVAENLEEDQKAERFAVLEAPTLPEKPVKPDRKKLLAFSLLLALVAPVGLVSFMEALHGTVRGVGQITAILGQKPLVTVPLIPVAAEVAMRRRMHLYVAAGGVLAVALALVAAHFLLLPLDVLFMKALIRLG
jgi:polysaccharide chain length determinant protein (PEP-CTERM system associated)